MGEADREPGSAGPEPPLRVFLSYRRSDDINVVGRFHDHLLESFGEDNVFRDLDSIHGGSNFPRVIKEEMGRIDAVVAMIGPTWGRRLGQPGDFVELEVGEALKRGCPVIPILIQGAPLPSPDELPASLRGLLDLNAVALRPDPDFRRDSAWAIEGILNEATAYRARKDAQLRQAEAATAAAVEDGAAGSNGPSVVPVADRDGSDSRWWLWALCAVAVAVIAVAAIVIGTRGGGGEGGSPSADSSPDADETPGSTANLPEITVPSSTVSSSVVSASAPSSTTAPTTVPPTTAAIVVPATLPAEPELSSTTGVPVGSVDCQPIADLSVNFCDGFDDALDSEIWTLYGNGGTVTLAGGAISLASDGPMFPYVVTKTNPFSGLTEYRLTIGYRFDTVGVFGAGVVAVDAEHPNGMEVGGVASQPVGKVWQDEHGQQLVTDCASPLLPADTERHTVEFDHRSDGTRTVTVDGEQQAQCQGEVEPVTLWFGNPSVPEACECTWTSVTVEFIRIDTPT